MIVSILPLINTPRKWHSSLEDNDKSFVVEVRKGEQRFLGFIMFEVHHFELVCVSLVFDRKRGYQTFMVGDTV